MAVESHLLYLLKHSGFKGTVNQKMKIQPLFTHKAMESDKLCSPQNISGAFIALSKSPEALRFQID